MANWDLIDWLTVSGTGLTLAGVVATFVQIRKTKKIAEAARNAAVDAKSLVRNTVFLVDLGRCSSLLDELRGLVQTGSYQAAVVRAQDLTKQLGFLRESATNHPSGFDFRKAITEMAVIRDAVQRKAHDGRHGFDQLGALDLMAAWSDQLAGLTGAATLAATEDNR